MNCRSPCHRTAVPLGRLLALVLGALAGALPASAGETVPGPVEAEVVGVVDGDTLRVRALVWVDLTVEVLVRIRGIDAPELHGRCPEERERAQEATALLATTIGNGPVGLTAVEGDKYFGRVLADVHTAAGSDVALAMLASGLVRGYDGGRRAPWCPDVVGLGN